MKKTKTTGRNRYKNIRKQLKKAHEDLTRVSTICGHSDLIKVRVFEGSRDELLGGYSTVALHSILTGTQVIYSGTELVRPSYDDTSTEIPL